MTTQEQQTYIMFNLVLFVLSGFNKLKFKNNDNKYDYFKYERKEILYKKLK